MFALNFFGLLHYHFLLKCLLYRIEQLSQVFLRAQRLVFAHLWRRVRRPSRRSRFPHLERDPGRRRRSNHRFRFRFLKPRRFRVRRRRFRRRRRRWNVFIFFPIFSLPLHETRRRRRRPRRRRRRRSTAGRAEKKRRRATHQRVGFVCITRWMRRRRVTGRCVAHKCEHQNKGASTRARV